MARPTVTPKPTGTTIAEVRYSLPELLEEVQREREAPTFAMERLDQSDINRFFGKKRAHRVVKSRK